MLSVTIICLVIGYVFGLLQTAFIIGKFKHIDIRDYGSGNSGTTNAMRTMGKKVGIITFFGDALKAVAAIIVTKLLFQDSHPDFVFIIALVTGFGVILGHNFPFYMNFRGGKGVATMAGVIFALAIYDWKFVVLGGCTFFITLAITRYVSFGSLCMMTALMIATIIWGQLGMIHHINYSDRIYVYIIFAVMTVLSFVRHRENIIRLLSGTERRVGEKKEDK